MTSKIKLPVREEYESVEHGQDGYFALVDADGKSVDLEDAADALNATGRRCDECALYQPYPERYGSPFDGRCTYRDGETDADDCCRKGWEPR